MAAGRRRRMIFTHDSWQKAPERLGLRRPNTIYSTPQPTEPMDGKLVRGRFTAATRAVSAGAFLLVVLSLVPSDPVYFRVENLLSHIGPLGAASRHVRSAPSTASSIILESFQGHSLEVEGVSIDLDYAVNPTEHVEQRKFTSEVLGEDRTYWVYLPPGYHDSTERYPTLYLLHGMSQGHRWWTEVARIDRVATAMIASGKIRPVVIVMPSGNRVEKDTSTTSLYDDRCETGLDVVARALKALGDLLNGLRIYKISCDGDFEEFIAREVVREIDSRYRTNSERYVGGFSVGGRGAVQLALGNGDVFDGAFGLSGSYDFLREELRKGRLQPSNGMKLFLGSGNKDQRGVYGSLNTFVFHQDLVNRGVEHLYCTYDGTHSDVAWVSAMPLALLYLLPADTPLDAIPAESHMCRGVCAGTERASCITKTNRESPPTSALRGDGVAEKDEG